MKLSDIMAASRLTSWAEIGLVLSFLTFVAIVAYVFVVRSRASYEDARHLPLDDSEGCQVRSSAVARNRDADASPTNNGNYGTADLAPPEISS